MLFSSNDMSLDELSEELFKGREKVFGITIDGPTSKDLDDAIWLDKVDNGYVAHISIADVGSFVEIDSEIDKKAFEQGFTNYFLNGNKPMLPRKLSEDLLSLNEGKKRLAITLSIPINNNLEIGSPKIKQTSLFNIKKTSYLMAESVMGTKNDLFLKDAYDLSRGLFEKRKTNRALVFFDKKSGFSIDGEGNFKILDTSQRYNSHLVIQEFMILANQTLAKYFLENSIPGLFRNHTEKMPSPFQKNLLSNMEIILCEGNIDKINILKQEMSLMFNKAEYAPTIIGHYALNLPAYMHFTSPIRRFSDLVNHRQLIASLNGNDFPYDLEQLTVIAEKMNHIEDGLKNKDSNYFKEQNEEKSLNSFKSENLDSLNSEEFYGVIKLATRDNLLNVELESQIYERFDKDKLREKDIYTILVETSNDDKWVHIKEKALKYLEKNPHQVLSMINLANNSSIWPRPTYLTNSEGCDHKKHYTSVSSMNIDDKEYYSEPQTAPTKKESLRFATLSLMEVIILGQSKKRNLVKADKLENKLNPFLKKHSNYIGALQDLLQQNHEPSPIYDFEKVGDEFLCMLFTRGLEGNEKIYSAQGSDKKEAKKLVSKIAFSELKSLYW